MAVRIGSADEFVLAIGSAHEFGGAKLMNDPLAGVVRNDLI
jgi:hypothetical protein